MNRSWVDQCNRFYRISWPDGELQYHPLQGVILNGSQTKVLPRGEFPLDESFQPFCLTIYLNHHCNLRCSYCYLPDKETQVDIDPEVVRAGAGIVAANCAQRSKPFLLGFHGGNEPLLHRELVAEIISICRDVASPYHLRVLPYCTTNGVISEESAEWASMTFHGMTLSWDGPPAIHDRYRCLANGSPSSGMVERTAGIIARSQLASGLRVRCTVTRNTADNIPEIARYFVARGARSIQFYPIFGDFSRRGRHEWAPDPAVFVAGYLRAKEEMRQNGCEIGFSGSRLEEWHDRFCPVLQNNLTLTPEGFVTGCFLVSKATAATGELLYGKYYPDGRIISINEERLARHRERCAALPSQCDGCFNFLHCAKGCPGVCPAIADEMVPPFDCRMERWIGLANLISAAGYSLPIVNADECRDFFARVLIEPEPIG